MSASPVVFAIHASRAFARHRGGEPREQVPNSRRSLRRRRAPVVGRRPANLNVAQGAAETGRCPLRQAREHEESSSSPKPSRPATTVQPAWLSVGSPQVKAHRVVVCAEALYAIDSDRTQPRGVSRWARQRAFCIRVDAAAAVFLECRPHHTSAGDGSPVLLRQSNGLVRSGAPGPALRTSYCGSSSEARTVRPAAPVSAVILRSTVPTAASRAERHVTRSPPCGTSRRSRPCPSRVPAPAGSLTSPGARGQGHPRSRPRRSSPSPPSGRARGGWTSRGSCGR